MNRTNYLLLCVLLASPLLALAQSQCVVISEIQIKPGMNNNFTTNINYQQRREWIELYNTSCDTVDVADWFIVTDLQNNINNPTLGYSQINSWASRYNNIPADNVIGPLTLNSTKIPPKGLAVILTPAWNKNYFGNIQKPNIPDHTIILTATAFDYWGSSVASGTNPPNGLLKNDNPGDFIILYDGNPNNNANLIDSVLWTAENGINATLQLDDDGTMRWHSSGNNLNSGGYQRDANGTLLARQTIGAENYTGQTTACNYNADFNLPDSICITDSAVFSNTSTGGGNFNWNFGDNNKLDSSLNASHLFASPGTYTVTLYQYDFCYIDSIQKTIKVLDNVAATLPNDTTICIGQTITLQASTSNNSYLWSNGETSASITVTPTNSTNYSLYTSNGMCFDTLSIMVTVNQLPTVNINGNNLICKGTNTLLTADYGNTFIWNTGDTSQSISVSPVASTHYYVTVSDGICTVNDSFPVMVDDIPTLSVSNDVEICPGEKAELAAFPVNYSSFYWSNGKDKESINVKPDSTTTFIATASNWCGAITDSVDVIVHPTPLVYAGEDQLILPGETAQLNGEGGPSWSWSSYGSLSCSQCPNPIATPTHTTQYILTVVNEHGCEASDEIVVEVDAFHALYVPNAFTPNGDGLNDIFNAKGSNIASYSMLVFNRWGEVIFKSDNLEKGWDGTYQGNIVQEGVYAYRIEFEPIGNGPQYQTGSITLIK